MSVEAPSHETTLDAILGGRLVLEQPRRGHRVGHDAVLLAAAVAAQPGDHVVDLGAGVGGAGLAVARRLPEVRVTLVEREPSLCVLAKGNVQRNGLEDRVEVTRANIAAGSGQDIGNMRPGTAQHVIMNPPFNDQRRFQRSPDDKRAAAHVGTSDLLATWCAAALRLLTPSGRVIVIWRADQLATALDAIVEGFGAIEVVPVYPRPNAAAIRVIISGRKGSKGSDALEPGIVLSDADGRPTPAANRIMRDGQGLYSCDV